MLNPAWNAIGIAKVTTTHGTLWVTSSARSSTAPRSTRPRPGRGGTPDPMIQWPTPAHRTTCSGGAIAPDTVAAVQPTIPMSAFMVSNRVPDAGTAVTSPTVRAASVELTPATDARDHDSRADAVYHHQLPRARRRRLAVAHARRGSTCSIGIAVGGATHAADREQRRPTGGGQQAIVTLAVS